MDWLEEAQLDNLQYWAGRSAKTQQHLTDEGIKAAEKQMLAYYQRTQQGVIEQFVATFEHLLARAEDGKVTPADLYKLDRYWQMQAQVAAELEKLGDRQAAYLSKAFTQQYMTVYEATAMPSDVAFATIDKGTAEQMISQIWCADGKAWSARIWHNRDLLREELNDKLIECVVGGKKPTQLKHALMERFSVSYHRANTLVQTEMAHIQTQAAQQRYMDAGITEMEFWAAPDERTCDVCGKLHKKRYGIHDIAPIPAHPNCRCCLIPVIEEKEVGEQLGEPTFPKQPQRPKKSDYDNPDDLERARALYRENRDNFDSDVEAVINWHLNKEKKYTTQKSVREFFEAKGYDIEEGFFDAIDINAMDDVIEAYGGMLDKYPQMMADYARLGARPRLGLSTDSDEFMNAVGGLNLNPKYFGSYEDALREAQSHISSGFTVYGDGTLKTSVRHEFGHELDFSIRASARFDAAPELLREYHAELNSITKKYGSEYAQVNDLEAFAEGFAEYEGNPEGEYGRAFGEFLAKWL